MRGSITRQQVLDPIASTDERTRARVVAISGVEGRVLRTGRAELVEDARTTDVGNVEPGVCALMCAPLRTGETPFGILRVTSRERAAWTAGHLKLVTSLAANAGAAISRAMLHGERLRQHLPVGSYLLELVVPGARPVRYPVMLGRRDGWAGRRPGEAEPFAVPIPEAGAIARGEIVVAAGCCELGGDELAPGSHRAERLWVDGFVIREHPVTFKELAAFLSEPEGAPFRRGVFRDGLEVWRPDWPAVGLSWDGAKAYAACSRRRRGFHGGCLRRSNGRRRHAEWTGASIRGVTSRIRPFHTRARWIGARRPRPRSTRFPPTCRPTAFEG